MQFSFSRYWKFLVNSTCINLWINIFSNDVWSSGSIFTELFSTEVRYSGATLGYQFGAIIGGAFAPTIAVKLWTDFDIVWVSAYIAFASMLTLISVMLLTETYKSNLNEEI
ncbi:MAG: hypothetical protein CM15mP76_12160 [Prochlorococcus sp.]|nr:MAG: hypothetical protein CM15mP76_12160 [Prochlorococcus sp.]